MMEDSVIRIPRQSCCRLCLAPDSECVSIFGTRAADKQPISVKIQSCVNIQVNASDRLSGKICHGCVSFLNSWTSFKGRCVAAQRQQKSWLAGQLKRQLGLQTSAEDSALENGADDKPQPMDEDGEEDETAAFNYYPQYHRKGGGSGAKGRVGGASNEDDDSGPVTMELDPSQFLARGDEDDDEDEAEEGEFVEPRSRLKGALSGHKSNGNAAPKILDALGLRNVNPMSMLATDLQDDADLEDGELAVGFKGSSTGPPGAKCQVCGLQFSNRTNARRHERNMHGLKKRDADNDSSSENNISNASNKVNGGTGGGSSQPAANAIAITTPAKPTTAPPALIITPVPASPATSVVSPSKAETFYTAKMAKYRHLLTETRLAFIREHARFLHQYQNMTCKCCNRQYFTYKSFMGHMRKKYPTLPRNYCFSCLSFYETKGHFIAHLKKRDCMNLFTLFMADDTIAKDPKMLSSAGLVATDDRLGLKDLLSNKMYGCKVCKEHVRLKNDFRQHLMTGHPEFQSLREPTTTKCPHCEEDVTDQNERRRHYSTLECATEILCTTCDQLFPTNACFLDHVYGTHLQEMNEANERATQLKTEQVAATHRELAMLQFEEAERKSLGIPTIHHQQHQQHQQQQQQLMSKKNPNCVCPICQKQYNNYYNVLWHFESKHPEHVPKTYKCEICEAMFTKQQLLKSHVIVEHEAVLKGRSDRGRDGGAAVGSYPCRHCETTLTKATDYVAHQLKAHPDEELLACHECEFVTEEREKLEEHLRANHLTLLKMRVFSCGACKQSFVSDDALKYHTMVQHAENESSEQLFKRLMRMGNFPAPKVVDALQDEDTNDNGAGDEGCDDELLKDKSFMARVKYEESQRVRECPVCMDKYSDLAAFIEHMNVHVDQDNVTNLDLEPGKSRSGAYHSRMRCRMCEKRISSKVGYKRHLLEVHGVNDCKIVQCDLCPGEFSNDKGLKVHLFRTHNICVKEDGEVVTGMQVLPPTTGDSQLAAVAAQLATKQQETIEYECQICHTVYRSLGQLRSHVSSVHQMNDFDAYLLQHGNGEIITPHAPSDGGASADEVHQQNQLDAMSLMMMSGLMDGEEPGMTGGGTDYTPIEVYFQCRYCDENFASRQKLTAHMNTHEEHDPTDYTCRECGNVYQSRKSLWVHRNKKHPRSQVPSPCEICKKVFFDKTELVYHLKTHVAQKMELMNELMSAAQNNGMDEGDVEDDSGSEGEENEEGLAENGDGVDGVKKYDCHVCERKFRDAGKLSQHLRFHEMQNNMFVLGAFTEAGMDDDAGDGGAGGGGGMNGGMNEGTGDPFEPQYNEDGTEEYQCDMCPKKFSQLMALRVHRGWHYRSPDGRQITEPGQTWQPGTVRSRASRGGASSNRNSTTGATPQNPTVLSVPMAEPINRTSSSNHNNNNNSISSSHNNNNNHLGSSTSPKMPKCQFCNSTFASSNNLRRHIVEVHKRRASGVAGSEAGGIPKAKPAGNPTLGTGFIERDKECQACGLTFETRNAWVEHKIGHAKVMRPSTTFEWNCEICGKAFTRKERLLQHMASHGTGELGVGGQKQGQSMGGDSGSENSRETMIDRSRDGQDLMEEEEEEDLDDDDEPMVVNPDVEMFNEDDDDDDEDDEDGDGDADRTNGAGVDEEEGEYIESSQAAPLQAKMSTPASSAAASAPEKSKLSCDLCQLSFTDPGDLRKHVLSHFFNGQGEGASVAAKKKTAIEAVRKEQGGKKIAAEGAAEEGPQAKKAKIDIPQQQQQRVKSEDQFREDVAGEQDEEDEEEGEYVQAQSRLDVTGADVNEDLDEGEYVEEYFDEESFTSPKKVTPAAVVVAPPAAACRLCGSAYENNFKALKCMESHRQRSKYQCQECELYFATTKQLAGHTQLMHPES